MVGVGVCAIGDEGDGCGENGEAEAAGEREEAAEEAEVIGALPAALFRPWPLTERCSGPLGSCMAVDRRKQHRTRTRREAEADRVEQ